jgi:crotonobetainyl-CoA:carnitine CoA-transferase CaiB-like acyl-CoA transferase
MRFPESSMQQAADGLVQLAASNKRQHRRFYAAIGESAEAERCGLEERHARYEEKQAMIASKLRERTAQEWEEYFQSKHVPATRVRELHEALKDPQLEYRPLLHRHAHVPGVDKPVTVPLTAFKFRHDGARADSPPPRLGEHTDEILKSVGYSKAEIVGLRRTGAAA